MRKILFMLFCKAVFGQVGIGTDQPDASSVLEISSKNKGLLIPRMTTNQKEMITNPQNSLIVYNTDLNCIEINEGTSKKPNWVCVNKKLTRAIVKNTKKGNTNSNQIVNDHPLVSIEKNSSAEFSIDFNQNISLKELDSKEITIVSNKNIIDGKSDAIEDKISPIIEKGKNDNSFILKLSGLKKNKMYTVNITPGFLKSNHFQFYGFTFYLRTSNSDIVVIHDENFRNYLINELKLNDAFTEPKNGIMIKDHPKIKIVKEIIATNNGIESLKGIEYFINLQSLSCENNDLKSLDLTYNTQLKELDCSGNEISKLDLSNNTKLKELDCSANGIPELDLSNNTKLKELDCSANGILKLDLSNNTDLTDIDLSDNYRLSSLDISNIRNLENLDCSGSDIKQLNLDNNTNLEDLDCSGNDIKQLNLDNNTRLEELDCSNNKLTSLNLNKNTNLENLDCSGNILNNLDMRRIKQINDITIVESRTNGETNDGNWNLLENLYVHDNIKNHQALKDLIQQGKDYNRDGKVTISTYNDNGEETCSDYDPIAENCISP